MHAPSTACPVHMRTHPGGHTSPKCKRGFRIQLRALRARMPGVLPAMEPEAGSGVVQNQRFSGPHRHQFAPSWASSQKNPEKTIKNVLKNGAKWRFFGGLERHFAVPAADGTRSQPASVTDFTSVASGCIEPAAAPEMAVERHFSPVVGQAFHP